LSLKLHDTNHLTDYTLKLKTSSDNDKITQIIKNWGGEIIVTRGKIHSANTLEGILANTDEEIAGICLYNIVNKECEIVLLEVFKENKGIGTSLIKKTIETARNNNCNRIWLITTNDNIDAMRFYQKKGFCLSNIYVNGFEVTRKIKKEVPSLGNYDIPIRDEIEFEMKI
jgi:ribosomal protein S18 acetylase RimI-like enzyme